MGLNILLSGIGNLNLKRIRKTILSHVYSGNSEASLEDVGTEFKKICSKVGIDISSNECNEIAKCLVDVSISVEQAIMRISDMNEPENVTSMRKHTNNWKKLHGKPMCRHTIEQRKKYK